MTTIDWERVNKGLARENERMLWKPYGLPSIADLERSSFHDAPISEPWELPEKMAVSVAITGALFRREQNPHQPITTDEILQSARACAAKGASAIHLHVRDDAGYNTLSLERFAAVIEPLKEEFPGIFVDGCMVPAIAGEYDEMKRVLKSGLLDGAPINTTATYIGDSLFAKPAPMMIDKTRLIVESGSIPEIAVYTDADVANADRFLFRSGILEPGQFWLVLPALPGCSPMDNPSQMVAGLTRITASIRDVDPEAMIMVCAAGRASMHLAVLAASLGLHIRVGMEDTYFMWPHREDRLESNEQAYDAAASLAQVVGRPVATSDELRSYVPAAARAAAR